MKRNETWQCFLKLFSRGAYAHRMVCRVTFTAYTDREAWQRHDEFEQLLPLRRRPKRLHTFVALLG